MNNELVPVRGSSLRSDEKLRIRLPADAFYLNFIWVLYYKTSCLSRKFGKKLTADFFHHEEKKNHEVFLDADLRWFTRLFALRPSRFYRDFEKSNQTLLRTSSHPSFIFDFSRSYELGLKTKTRQGKEAEHRIQNSVVSRQNKEQTSFEFWVLSFELWNGQRPGKIITENLE